jgi:hypothetical protein
LITWTGTLGDLQTSHSSALYHYCSYRRPSGAATAARNADHIFREEQLVLSALAISAACDRHCVFLIRSRQVFFGLWSESRLRTTQAWMIALYVNFELTIEMDIPGEGNQSGSRRECGVATREAPPRLGQLGLCAGYSVQDMPFARHALP